MSNIDEGGFYCKICSAINNREQSCEHYKKSNNQEHQPNVINDLFGYLDKKIYDR